MKTEFEINNRIDKNIMIIHAVKKTTTIIII